MKVAILLALVAVAASAPADVEKRGFLTSLNNLLNNFKNALANLWQDASAAFKAAWNQAKAQVESFGHQINFDEVVSTLVDQIDSSTTRTGCIGICVTGASSLGLPALAAPLLEQVCDPLCAGALSFLEEKARQGK